MALVSPFCYILGLDVAIPKGVLTCVTGVSGSGKSTLVNDIFYRAIFNKINRRDKDKNIAEILGIDEIDKVIQIDQTPIGRTPRSNPATYSGVFTKIRELFASTPSAKEKGFDIGKFSFNVEGGRCEACAGDGLKRLRMYFMADVFVPCEVCGGKRYSREVLDVKFKGKSIYDVLEMTIDEAYVFFDAIPQIKSKLQTLVDVGLGYIKLGQSATTLSGGEAQRLKLATELTRRDTGNTVYILDEPTTGLHSYDVKKLVDILQRLVGNGNTVVVIEHNLDIVKTADYIIDMGPEGGEGGGKVIVHHEMRRGCAASGVKRIRIHGIRHSHISLLIDMGFSAVAIADRVGHESIDMTYRYAHVFPSTQVEVVSKLNDLIVYPT